MSLGYPSKLLGSALVCRECILRGFSVLRPSHMFCNYVVFLSSDRVCMLLSPAGLFGTDVGKYVFAAEWLRVSGTEPTTWL